MNNLFPTQSNDLALTEARNYLFLFLLWPFIAFISAVLNYESKTSRRIVYLYLIYYGLTYVMGDLGDVGPDAERYALGLKANALLPLSDIFKVVAGLYETDTSIDILEPIISFIVSRFTDNFRILFAVFAAIFGFFYLKSINLLFDRYKENPGWNALIHLLFFAAILPITAINGFRMWTAAWVFFYGAYHVILNRDPRFFLISLAASLVHWSFIIPNSLLIAYFFAGNRNIVYLPLALVSFIVPRFMTQYFNIVALRLGGPLQDRYQMYSDNAYVEAVQDISADLDWFLKIGYDMIFYYLVFAIVMVRVKSRKLASEPSQDNLFSFLLLLLAFVNFGMAIPSLGNRFQVVFFIFGTVYVFNYLLKVTGNRINLLTFVGLFPMLLYVAIVFRQGSDSINAWIFAPGFGVPFFVPDLSVAHMLFY